MLAVGGAEQEAPGGGRRHAGPGPAAARQQKRPQVACFPRGDGVPGEKERTSMLLHDVGYFVAVLSSRRVAVHQAQVCTEARDGFCCREAWLVLLHQTAGQPCCYWSPRCAP